MKVLVAEKIGDSGVELLRSQGFDVDIGTDWAEDELDAAHRRVRRPAHPVGARRSTRTCSPRRRTCEAIGRAGVGVDNVDVPAATKRGIVVANAPQSNVVTAAEHTLALLLALARNIPQAHASLVDGRWERSKYSGVELMDKTLGILGFGRIGQLVAQRAQGFGMRIVAFDPFVGAERYRELGVEKARDGGRRLRRRRLHHHPPAQDAGDGELARTPRRSPKMQATASASSTSPAAGSSSTRPR